MVALFGGEIAVILQGRRDIIGFDPRGVNMTTPSLGCYDYDDEEERSAYNERLLGLPFEARGGRNASSRAEEAFFRRFDAHLQKRTLACQTEGNQKMLRASSTALVARDMKRIMEALGEEKLSFYGFSYGTALGATFAAMFPNLVDRFVLDGVSDAAAYHRDYGTRRWAEGSMVDTNKVRCPLSRCMEPTSHRSSKASSRLAPELATIAAHWLGTALRLTRSASATKISSITSRTSLWPSLRATSAQAC